MSNVTIPTEPRRTALAPPQFALTAAAWSEGQIERIKSEWQNALRAFAYHPFVAIYALRGDPPRQYRVDFRVRSVVMDDTQQLKYVDAVAMEIWLPPDFPTEAPLMRPLAAVFHPNFSAEAVHFSDPRQSSESLIELIKRVGEFLACRGYDPRAVVNRIALQWFADNARLLPLDARADFSPAAGGEPLARIEYFGGTTLEQMQRSMDEMLAALAGKGGGPTSEQVRSYAHQTRLAMSVFLGDDVPPKLREQAEQFDQFATNLPAFARAWEDVRQLNEWSRTVRSSSGELTEAVAQLRAEVEKLSAIVEGNFVDAADAARHIPPAAALQPILTSLPAIYKDAASRAEALYALGATATAAAASDPQGADGAMTLQLAAARKEADENVQFARHTATETLAAFDPMLALGRAEMFALRAIGGWREYIDTMEKASLLEGRAAALGGDGIEAYTIKLRDGEFGPYQLEQEIKIGETSVAVSSMQPGAVEVFGAENDAVLGRGTAGSAEVKAGGSDAPTVMTFTLSDGCDQLLLQIDYAIQQATSLLPKLQAVGAGGARSWCGRMLALFADGEAQQGARAAQRRAIHRWESLAEDLKALGSFKARLATCFLVKRAEPLFTTLQARKAAYKATLEESTRRVSAIALRSTRDLERGQLIVPPKHAGEYAEQTAAMEGAKRGLGRVRSRTEKASKRLLYRLGSPRGCGRPEEPVLRRIPPVSAALIASAGDISDDALREAVARLAVQLKIPLLANIAAPVAPLATKARPVPADLAAPATEAPVVSEAADSDPPAPNDDDAVAVEAVPEQTEAADEPLVADDEAFVVDEPFVVDDEPFVVEDDLIVDDEHDQIE